MSSTPENTGRNQAGQFQKGLSGNPLGKPKGTRHKTTLVLEALIDGEGEAIVRSMIEAAKKGDVQAGRALLDRLIPANKDRLTAIQLPELNTAIDAPRILSAIVDAVAAGELTTKEASDLASLIERFIKVIETTELEQRLTILEGKLKK